MNTQHKRNVIALCERLDTPYPTRERDCPISALAFYLNQSWYHFPRTTENRTARFFFQEQAVILRDGTMTWHYYSPFIISEGQRFFAEAWDPENDDLLAAFQAAEFVKINWKPAL